VNQKNKSSFLIVLLALGLIVAYTMFPFTPSSLSILAVSTVEIDPQYGYEDPNTGEWVGSYWVVLSTTHTYGDHVFYELNDIEVQKYGENTVDGDELHVDAQIQINVQVGQPYVQRPLTKTPYTVSKPIYGQHSWITGTDTHFKEHYDYNYNTGEWVKVTDGPIPQQDIVIKETASDWMRVVPLTVTATKIDKEGKTTMLECDGQTSVHLNKTGPEALLPITFQNPNDETETFTFKLEGQLDTGYLVTLPDMSILREDVIFQKTGDFLNHVKYSKTNSEAYINYWYGSYGIQGWNENSDGTIYPQDSIAPGSFSEIYGYDFYYYPAPMRIYSDPPPISGVNYQGLVSYLESNCRRLENWEIDRWGQGYEVTEDMIKVFMPYDSWLWLYTLTVSTELADTYVWKPHYADGEILSVKWLSSGNDHATISDQDRLDVKVKNVGTVDGNLRVKYTISPDTAPLLIIGDGKYFSVNEEYTFQSVAKNLGPQNKVDGEILIELVNDANDVRDTETVYFTLLPITGVTTLNVKVVEKGNTAKLLSGITVSVQYGTQSDVKVSSGGWASFSLGAYQGPVEVVAAESVKYYGAVATDNIETGGNLMVLELQLKEAPPPSPFPWWLTAIIIIVVGAVIIMYTMKRRGGGEL